MMPEVEAIDLIQFCGVDDEFRPYLKTPFRQGGFVYATNGHILVRVADDERFPVLDKVKANVGKVLGGLERAEFELPPPVKIPPKPPVGEVDCLDCDGRGTEHNCPDCECTCEACGGKGRVKQQPRISSSLCGHLFDVDYLRQMFDLPNLEIAPRCCQITDSGSGVPLLFRFSGGIGALMPLRAEYEKHIVIEQSKDASIT